MNGLGNVSWETEMNSQERCRRVNLFRRFPWLKILILSGFIFVIIWVVVVSVLPRSTNFVFSDSTPDMNNIFISETGDINIKIELANIWEAQPVLTDKKLVALTFDDGPSEHTSRLLDILKEKGVRATFFALGSRAMAFPDVIRREASDGHEVESHTMNHANLTTLTAAGVSSEVAGAESAICGVLNRQGCIKYVRPPYGAVNGVVKSVVRQPLMGWGVDSLDWKLKNVEQTRAEVISHVFDGAVILMHDVYDTSVDAVGGIIDALRADGYTFVTVDEMVQERDPGITPGVLYGIFKP